jgi:hypothetical protein
MPSFLQGFSISQKVSDFSQIYPRAVMFEFRHFSLFKHITVSQALCIFNGVSQFKPVKPVLHSHSKATILSFRFLHVPPFIQGVKSHELIDTVSQKFPIYPIGHSQVYPKLLFEVLHVPPFKQLHFVGNTLSQRNPL